MRRVRIAVAVCLSAAAGRAAAPVSPPVTEYRIDVSLDPSAKKLTGQEHLLWRNPSGDTVRDLEFHLYLNAFKNNRTTFMRESGGQLRRDRAGRKKEDWGWIDVESMRTGSGQDLRPGFSFAHPDTPDPQDQTVLRVALPAPVAPHGEVSLDIGFSAKLPRVFARTGFVRDFFLAGQWFPKIGVYEPAGTRHRAAGGWNCHQFHANSEFYADYGTYDVRITVPDRFVVGATGQLVSARASAGKTTYHYRQENVIDFAWTADPRFRAHEFRFDPSRDIPEGWQEKTARLLGLPPPAIALRPVAVRILMQPDHDSQWARYRDSAKLALSYYGLHYGAYPFPTLTIVDPPEDGAGAGGMEYPTFITAETSTRLAHWPFSGLRLPEIVTIHEFGHQYWYFMVGSNEFEESWMDEGINSYSEERCVDTGYAWRAFALPGELALSDLAADRLEYLFYDELDPIEREAWGYFSGASYGVNSYAKPALILRQMEADLGEATFARCLRAYFQTWSFRHPDTPDFFDVFEKVSGRDLSRYEQGVFHGTRTFDIRVESARTAPAARDRGVFDRGGKRVTLPEETKLPKTPSAAKRTKEYESVVVVGRTGSLPHGAPVVFNFEDGRSLRRFFPGSARWMRYRLVSGSRLASVQADPALSNTWDTDLLDNSWRRTPDRAAVHKLEWRLEYFTARLLQILWAAA